MRVFLAGGSGFIGGHLLHALLARGHTVTCLARGAAADELAARSLEGVTVARGEYTRPETWRAAVAGHAVVMNAVGLIRERPGSSFESVHTEAAIALFEAGAAAGAKLIQISALGAEAEAGAAYLRTKGRADRRLMELGAPWVVFRPSIVHGAGDHSMTMFLELAALPVISVPGDGATLLRPVHVDDLARAVLLAAERPEIRDVTVDVGGAAPVSLDALMDALARWLGRSRALKLHVPWSLMSIAAAVTDALGGRGPITGEELRLLRRGSSGDNARFIELFGFEPATLEAGLARRPRDPSTLRGVRVALLRLPLRAALAVVWIAAGVISAVIQPVSEGLGWLARAGITGPLALPALYAASALDVALGLALLAGWRPRLVGGLQLVVLVFYTTVLTAAAPELWLHPFGTLTKNLVLLVAVLLWMALEEP